MGSIAYPPPNVRTPILEKVKKRSKNSDIVKILSITQPAGNPGINNID
jgi:hypothetical protein